MILTGNTILITGGTSGIGLELASRFLSLGNRVIITGRDPQKAELVKQRFPALELWIGDLTEDQSLQSLVFTVTERFPELNVLINNAAVQYNYAFADEPLVMDKISYELTANLAAPIKLTTALLPLLLQKKHSAVVLVSSGLAIAPKRSASVYCATKAAIHSYSKSLRYQLEASPVKVFEIIPALVETPMTEGRGKSKISPAKLADEFLKNFGADVYESYTGKAKLLRLMARIWPAMADRIMKNGL